MKKMILSSLALAVFTSNVRSRRLNWLRYCGCLVVQHIIKSNLQPTYVLFR